VPIEDARRWNERYRRRTASGEHPRPFLVEQAGLLAEPGLALDVAMGQGGNAGFLLSRGWRVVGLDISAVALLRAKTLRPDLVAVLVDLTRLSLPSATFDLILNFYYLQRDLWPQYRRALKPGGLLIFETFRRDPGDTEADLNPAYLLAAGELPHAFQDWELLVYRETLGLGKGGRPRAIASLVARRPVAQPRPSGSSFPQSSPGSTRIR
jgi:tellurite methyltransferase